MVILLFASITCMQITRTLADVRSSSKDQRIKKVGEIQQILQEISGNFLSNYTKLLYLERANQEPTRFDIQVGNLFTRKLNNFCLSPLFGKIATATSCLHSA